jgi:non-specific serine/threonine protein kinase/serine/threonine-protein kinase
LLEEHDRPGEFLPDPPFQSQPLGDLSGRTVGQYRLVRLIGFGGMSAVYLAERTDGAYSKQVAVKLLAAPFPQAPERFHRERELLARLDHSNITRMLDGGSTIDGFPYLVLEYVEGLPIDRYCTEHDLSIDRRLALLLQVCAGIAHAHQNLIVHRDIKPQNILVSADGVAKVLDFGIAKLLGDSVISTLYRPATPAYASPEQLRGDPVTTASDVYSVGVVAYLLLTGCSPYPLRSGRLDEIVQAVLTGAPVRPSLAPGLSHQAARALRGDLDNILLKAIAKDPARRYASVQQFAEDIERYRGGFPVLARRDSFGYRARKFLGRYPFASAFALLALAFLMAGIALSSWQARVAQRRFEDARQFAHSVLFDVEDSLQAIPGTTSARKLVVETALRYLDRLSRDNISDAALREELASAYLRVGRVQGGAFVANLGDTAGAVASFRKALAAAGQAPATPALQRLVINAHTDIASLAADPVQSGPEFHAAINAGEAQLAANARDPQTLRLVASAYRGLATAGHLSDNVIDEERMSARSIDLLRQVLTLAPGNWRDAIEFSRALAQHALALEQQADYAGSLAELQRARATIDSALKSNPGNQVLVWQISGLSSRAGSVLRAMGKYDESTAELQEAIRLLEPLVAADPHNIQYRGDMAYNWFRLAETLRGQGRLEDALVLHRKALAARRERESRDPTYTFIRWDLTRSLNAVADLLLSVTPRHPEQAGALFDEACKVAEETLRVAPSFNELRKQLARAEEGLARVAMLRGRANTVEARQLLERSLHTWREVQARSAGDRQDTDQPQRVRSLLASLPSAQ